MKRRRFLSGILAGTGAGLSAIGAAMLLPMLNSTQAVAAEPQQAKPTPTLVAINTTNNGAKPAPTKRAPVLAAKPTATLAAAGNTSASANGGTGRIEVAKLPVGASPHWVIPAIPDKIVIPVLQVSAKIQAVGPGKRVGSAGVEWGAPANKNVGWHDYSGKLGETKNIVLNGHNNIYGSVFRKLYTLQPGDQIELSAQGVARIYEVTQVHKLLEKGQPYEVRLQNAQYILPKNDDILTVVSCWPETNNTHRIVVVAKPMN